MLLYIDPGTGSMLFSILVGVVSTLVFFGQRLFMKLKFVLSGGKAKKISNAKIPYVIFCDHKRYWNVFKPVCDEFEKRGVDLVYWTASPDWKILNYHVLLQRHFLAYILIQIARKLTKC